MTPEERAQKRAEFEATITELPDDEKATKLSEWDTENPEKPKEGDEGDYRGKLNATNRFLEKEGYKFENGKWVKPAADQAQAPVQSSLSAEDVIALRDVPEEDIPNLMKWAKREGVSLAEARKDADLKIILAARAEERKTAAATQTSGARGAKKPTGADLLDKAIRTNELPEDDEGMQAIAAARQPRKK